jgi:hypothetical protein
MGNLAAKVLRDGLPHVGQRLANTQIRARHGRQACPGLSRLGREPLRESDRDG